MKYQNLFIIFFVAIFASQFPNNNLSAQPISPIHQGNLPAFMVDINNYFNGIIHVSMANIETSLFTLLPPNGNGNCSEPDAQIVYMNNDSIGFDWPMVAGATEYRAMYYNLYTGDKEIFLTNDLYYDFEVPNGLYLFLFQSNCSGNWSKANIIIVDKVLHLEINTSLNCGCTQEPGMTTGYETTNYYYDDFLDIPSLNEFDIILNLGEMEEHHVIHLLRQENDYDNPITFDINPMCGNNLMKIHNGVFYGLDGTIAIADTLGSYYLNTNTGFLYDIQIGVCTLEPEGRSNNGQAHFTETPISNIYPNPFKDELTAFFPNGLKNISQISLINLNGKEFKNLPPMPTSDLNKIKIETNHLPDGIYFLKIINDDIIKYQKIIKQ